MGHQLAAAQHGNAVRYAQHLTQFVTDENDRQTLRDHLRQHLKQALRLVGREHGGGLIQNQNSRAPVQRLQNLNPLALADRQAAHARIGLHRESKARSYRQQLRAGLRTARERLPQRLAAHHHVVQHGQIVSQGEVLVHHADARLQRGFRVAGCQRFAKNLDVARIRNIVPKQDRHQRGFARSVLAQEGQHLASTQRERDVVICHQWAKALADVVKLQNGSSH